jgi:hypothetical protein
MTLIDAIKSGKPFRRKYEDEYGWRNANEIFKAHEIVADDWEIQSEKSRVFLWEHYDTWANAWVLNPTYRTVAQAFEHYKKWCEYRKSRLSPSEGWEE